MKLISRFSQQKKACWFQSLSMTLLVSWVNYDIVIILTVILHICILLLISQVFTNTVGVCVYACMCMSVCACVTCKNNIIDQNCVISFISESHAFQTVVLVRESFTGGFAGLQNTNYCHPGFGDGQFWSDSVLKEFEKEVIKRSCLDEKSSAEQEIYSLANFFKSACRPGQWALDDLQNKKLSKYKFIFIQFSYKCLSFFKFLFECFHRKKILLFMFPL